MTAKEERVLNETKRPWIIVIGWLLAFGFFYNLFLEPLLIPLFSDLLSERVMEKIHPIDNWLLIGTMALHFGISGARDLGLIRVTMNNNHHHKKVTKKE